ncbi:MAG TPA: hypothetical protein VIW25_13955 [Nitrososphaeraceae archaeon]
MARNSTPTISGKTFNVITVECPFSSLVGCQGAAATTSIKAFLVIEVIIIFYH